MLNKEGWKIDLSGLYGISKAPRSLLVNGEHKEIQVFIGDGVLSSVYEQRQMQLHLPGSIKPEKLLEVIERYLRHFENAYDKDRGIFKSEDKDNTSAWFYSEVDFLI